MATRPTGVTILVVLAAIGGIFGILGSLALLGFGGYFAAVGLGGFAFVVGLLLLVDSIAELAFAYGGWTAKPWAWTLGIVAAAAGVVISIVEVILGYVGIGSVLVSIVIAAILIYYLNTPGVRSYFGAPAKGWPFMGGS